MMDIYTAVLKKSNLIQPPLHTPFFQKSFLERPTHKNTTWED